MHVPGFVCLWSSITTLLLCFYDAGNFGTVFVDQSYWQCAVAAKPSQGVWGFLVCAGGFPVSGVSWREVWCGSVFRSASPRRWVWRTSPSVLTPALRCLATTTSIAVQSSPRSANEPSTGRVDPRVGSGWVSIIAGFSASDRAGSRRLKSFNLFSYCVLFCTNHCCCLYSYNKLGVLAAYCGECGH